MYINWKNTMSIAYLNNAKEIDDHIETLNLEIGYIQKSINAYTLEKNDSVHPLNDHII